MRSKNTFLLLSVVVGVLVMSMAYAAISNITLNVTGNVIATPDSGNFRVEFDENDCGYDVNSGNGKATISADGTKATMNVSGFTAAGDSLTAWFYIDNLSHDDLYAKLSCTISVSNTTYFTATADFDEDILEPGWGAYLYITVKLKKTPITSNATSTITVRVTAEPTHES